MNAKKAKLLRRSLRDIAQEGQLKFVPDQLVYKAMRDGLHRVPHIAVNHPGSMRAYIRRAKEALSRA